MVVGVYMLSNRDCWAKIPSSISLGCEEDDVLINIGWHDLSETLRAIKLSDGCGK